MANDESLEQRSDERSKTVSSDAVSWGSKFIAVLEMEFADIASELALGAAEDDFRRAMVTAVVNVLRETGAKSTEMSSMLDEAASRLLPEHASVEWTDETNARRLELIDKLIQQQLSPDEAIELERLTESMRAHCDTEEAVPLEGARRLHRQLLKIDDSEQAPG